MRKRKVSSDYGEKKALELLEKIQKKKEKLQNAKPVPLNQRKKKVINAPNLEWEPMQNEKIKLPKYPIKWDDVITDTISNELSTKFLLDSGRNGPSKAQILKLGTGLGKTAIAVKTIGLMQLELGKQIPIVVATTSKVVAGLGWQSTILSWNTAHPDNKIHPVLITSHDKLASACQHADTIKKILQSLDEDSVLVLDEVHKYKNPTSKRSKQLQKLHMFRKLGLTATPIGNDPILDIASYLIMAGYYRNKSDFISKMGLADPSFYTMHGALNLYSNGTIDDERWPEYHLLIDQLSSIMLSPEVDTSHIDIPHVNQNVHQLPFDLSTYLDIGSLVEAKRNRLFPSSIDFTLAVIERLGMESGRLNKLIEIVKDENTQQPLIFYQHNNVKDSIEKVLNENGIPYQIVQGGSDFGEIDLESDDPILMQYQAGGEGVELKHSNCSIFYENQYSYLSLKQALGRNVRRASANDEVDHHYLISEHGIDKEIYTRVQNHEELSKQIVSEIIEKQLS